MRNSTLPRVAPLLFCSGACALIYQVAWFRELRLIFGASTAASAAVLAVFMGGLGIGGRILGRRADAVENPLAYYARLEMVVALTAAITPALVFLAQHAYLGIGGASSLGSSGATVARLILSVFVLGLPTFMMGGTLPAAARAVEKADDAGRQRVATLYGVNTVGAVVGTLAANFVLLEVFGTRLTLWLGCLINLLVAVAARGLSRRGAPATIAKAAPEDAVQGLDERLRWFPPLAAAVAGLAFMLMELVWYRMLAPLLGGSSYTFGLILAIALTGIGLGGLIYARTKRPATLSLFAATCALEAFFLLVPYALGDRVAVLALLLRPLARVSFAGAVLSWSSIAALVVLPAAIISGFQFPVVIGLYGHGAKNVAKDVGNAYLANTVGSIVGSIGGGFGLIPLLSAPRCWQLVAVVLMLTALFSAVLDLRFRRAPAALATVFIAVLGALLLTAPGPTAAWRHSAIGAGRADLENVTKLLVEQFKAKVRSDLLWEEDGLESSVAVARSNGLGFLVNGKADGNIITDAGTQVMSGVLAALLHENPTRALVVGLGTGSTAGWLGAIGTMQQVDVVELEPAILRVARDCALANEHVMDNPKVKITLGDAREVLRTTKQKYDIIFSEPSNPYRAGISSLYTEEFYRSAIERLAPSGLFVQWVQSYEVDAVAVATAAVTLRQVFPSILMWETTHGDLLLVASRTPLPIDIARIRERLQTEPYAKAARSVWRTTSAEGVLSHFIADAGFIDVLAERSLGPINTDDQNFLEFAFARNVGNHRAVFDEIRDLAYRLDHNRPAVKGEFDTSLVEQEKLLSQVLDRLPVRFEMASSKDTIAFAGLLQQFVSNDYQGALKSWRALAHPPRSYHASLVLANAAARAGDDAAETLIPETVTAAERELLRGIWLTQKNQKVSAVAALERGFVAARTDPWVTPPTMLTSLQFANQLGERDPVLASRLFEALSEPFAVSNFQTARVESYIGLARNISDPARCVRALDVTRPWPFERLYFETQVICYKRANDPRLANAEEEYGRLLLYSLPFGADIPSPPRQKKPAPSGGTEEPLKFGLDAGIVVDATAP
jgi:predicted membrane-bound spermidine synthase